MRPPEPPRLPPPPPIDPETLLIIALLGALFGAASTAFTYVAFKTAEKWGKELRILPEIKHG